MSKLRVEVVKIDNIQPHPNADRLELATVFNWVCVVQKGWVKAGDTVIYIPIDSVLPQPLIDILFGPNSKIKLNNGRIKTIKIRGAVSQGLIVDPVKVGLQGAEIGSDVAKILNITKYEPPEATRGVNHNAPAAIKKDINNNFKKYTDIENIKNHKNVFFEGEFVSVTEKIHGCLRADTMIYLSDGTKKTIKEIVDNKLDVKVMALDDREELVESKILHWFDNGISHEWRRIRFTRNRVGRGNHFGSIVCTPNHRFYNPTTLMYVPCSELKVGDDVLLVRNEFNGDKSSFGPELTKQTILEISDINTEKMNLHKYDLETEHHNFIADGLVVHNSNWRCGYVPTQANTIWKKIKSFLGLLPKFEFVYGSHNVQLQNKGKGAKQYHKIPKGNIYSEAIDKYNIKGIIKEGEVLYGEVYGDGIQKGFTYGCGTGERGLVIFDVMVNGRYLDAHEARKFCRIRGLPFVPELYVGGFYLEKMQELTKGASVLFPDQPIREGIVIKPLQESTCHVGRKVLKFVSDDYLLLKDNTDWH